MLRFLDGGVAMQRVFSFDSGSRSLEWAWSNDAAGLRTGVVGSSGTLWHDLGSGLILNDFIPRKAPGLFCLPGECFCGFELCQRLCYPAVFLLLSLQDSLRRRALHIEKPCVSFKDCLPIPAVGQHYSHGRIVFEVPVTGHCNVQSEIEDSVNNNEVCR